MKNYEAIARNAGLKDRFGDGWQAVCERHGLTGEKPLTEKRKADRAKLAALVMRIAAEYGWKAELCEFNTTLRTRVNLEGPRGLCVSVEFESGSAQVDNYCLPWHIAGNGEAQLSKAFGVGQGSEVNPHHRAKCTTFAFGAAELERKLRLAMAQAADGSAFMAEPAYIMKNHAAYHPANANHYELYTAQWERLANRVMHPSEAEEYAANRGLKSVSPMEVYKGTNGRMGDA